MRYDYLPFGGDLLAGTGGRTTALGYPAGADGFSPKYTGQMRDVETGLDYLHARYYSAAQGRFTGVDPDNAGASLGEPQSWNGYTYVNNNPLNATDPSGLGFWSSFGQFVANLAVGWLFGGWGGGASSGGLGGVIPNAVGANSGPWNEQLPVSVGGGPSVSLGGVYGGGSTGSPIFTFEQSGSKLSNWLGGVISAASMAADWEYGLGPDHRTFGPNSLEAKNMRSAPGVERARQFFYKKTSCGPLKPVYNYSAEFGLRGLVRAGLNPTQQFVGSFRVDVVPTSAGDAATFTLTNTTSFTSFFYGIGPSWNRSNRFPTMMGNMSQTYYWTEPIPDQILDRSCGGGN